MEKHTCDCGESYILIEPIQEELHLITRSNCQKVVGGYYVNYICNNCGEIISHFDKEMVVE